MKPWTRPALLPGLLLGPLFILSGCLTLKPATPVARAELAHISGDLRVRAGAPLTLYLRSVDDRALEFWHSGADVEEGAHRLLVDCAVNEGEHLSRHELNVDVNAGTRYRLAAEATPRGCTSVGLIQVKP